MCSVQCAVSSVQCAVQVTSSALEAMQTYYDQLGGLETKIPFSEAKIYFKWLDAFDKGGWLGGQVSQTYVYYVPANPCPSYPPYPQYPCPTGGLHHVHLPGVREGLRPLQHSGPGHPAGCRPGTETFHWPSWPSSLVTVRDKSDIHVTFAGPGPGGRPEEGHPAAADSCWSILSHDSSPAREQYGAEAHPGPQP